MGACSKMRLQSSTVPGEERLTTDASDGTNGMNEKTSLEQDLLFAIIKEKVRPPAH